MSCFYVDRQISEETELKDEAGRRHHEQDGARIYREIDVQQFPFAGVSDASPLAEKPRVLTLSLAVLPAHGCCCARKLLQAAPAIPAGASTLSRRQLAEREVERRRAEAAARSKEAGMRSLERRGASQQAAAQAEREAAGATGGPGAAAAANKAMLLKMRAQMEAAKRSAQSETGF